MQWNISAEFVSAIITLIILVYSSNTNAVPTQRNKVFKLCMYFTFLAIILDIISAICIEQAAQLPLLITETVTNLFFLISPLVSAVCIAYVIMLIYEKNPNKNTYKFAMWSILVIYITNVIIVFANPFINCLFFFDDQFNYVRGSLNSWPFTITYIYLLMGVVSCLFESSYLEKSTVHVIVISSLISAILLIIQQIYPYIILSGTVATICILIFYLNFQNKKIVTDNLTGLSNRETLTSMLNYLVRKKDRMYIILISLDDFKYVNNKFGQHFGNHFLHEIAQYLRALLPERCIYRYGGDEFAVIINGKLIEKASWYINEILSRFQNPWSINSFHYKIGASFAVVQFPEQAKTNDDIISLLEYAIKESKNNGKGKIIYCNDQMQLAVEHKNKIINAIKNAMEYNGFEVYYQPIHRLSDGSIISAESLLRLHDDELGLISPSEFIPIAEEIGLITEIGFIALDMVCKALKYLDTHNIPIESISTNYSSQQFSYQYITKQTMNIIRANGVDPSKVKIEITESLLIDHLDDASSLMLELNKEGVKFLLDDFGTGYSNLMYVVKLPLECIKLDKTLIHDIIGKENLYSLVKSLSKGFAQNGAYVVAEGVETVEQAKLLKKLSCNFVQGYLYSRPMPFDKFVQFLNKERKRHQSINAAKAPNDTLSAEKEKTKKGTKKSKQTKKTTNIDSLGTNDK